MEQAPIACGGALRALAQMVPFSIACGDRAVAAPDIYEMAS
jgi:hypothetical protein